MKNINEKLKKIRKLFNSGISQSADVLSRITGKSVKLKVPEIYLLPVNKALEILGEPDEKVVSIYMKVHYGIKTGILLIMNEDSAKYIVKFGSKSKKSKESKEYIGILQEIANILISYFLNTLANFLRRRIIPDVPDFAFDMKGAILDLVLAEHKNENLEVLLITADIYCQDILKVSFVLVPEDDTIEELLEQTCI